MKLASSTDSDKRPGQSSCQSLADSLRLLQNKLVPDFISSEHFEFLLSAGSYLPAVHKAGFEYRLGNRSAGVDLQQVLTLKPSDMEAFNKAMFRPGLINEDIKCFVAAWQESDSPLQMHIRQLWLEFDTAGQSANALIPSVFLSFKRLDTKPEVILAVSNLAHHLLAGMHLSKPVKDCLATASYAFARHHSVTHVGFMLSRPGHAVRMISPLFNPTELTETLHMLGWNENLFEFKCFAESLFRHFSEISLCVDCTPEGLKGLSFECFFSAIRDNATGLEKLFLELIADGTCSRLEFEAIEGWPGQLTPADHAEHWPENLVMRSIFAAHTEFCFLECRLGHIKFSWEPNGALMTKVYFGYFEKSIDA